MINVRNSRQQLFFQFYWLLGIFVSFSTCVVQQNAKPTDSAAMVETESKSEDGYSSDVTIDSSALNGLPIEYQQPLIRYLKLAVKNTAGKGRWPIRNLAIFDKKLFPQVVRISETKTALIELLVLPEPKVVRAFGTVERDFEELAQTQPIKHPNLWQMFPDDSKTFTVTTNILCVPKDLDTKIILPSPKGTGSRNDNGLPWIYEYQSTCSFEEFIRFPELSTRKESEVWQGIMATGLVFDDNPVVRWVSLRNPSEPQIKTWVAYAITDACGALPEGSGGLAGYGITYFLPSLKGPHVPTLKLNEEGLRTKRSDLPRELGFPPVPVDFNLLRIPTPRSVMEKSRIPQWHGADWSICEEYYSEHEIPAWKLTITKDSKPYRETFCIEHGLDDSGQEIWKLIVFATIEPKDLLKVICKIKEIDATEIPIGELESAFNELTAVRERLLKK